MSLHSPNLTNFKGGIFMSKKITFLVLALIVVFSFSLIAEPVLKPYPENSNPSIRSSKAAFVTYLCDDINYRSISPKAMAHICIAPGGLVGTYFGRGTGTSDYHGFYCYYSTDYGVTFTQSPATGPVITPETYYERIYTALELSSSALAYAPYTINNIRIPSGGAAGDTIVFAADLSGLGAGDWFSLPAADNNDGSYRYLPNIRVVNDADVFAIVMSLNGEYFLHHSSDYGFTWAQLYEFDAAYFAPLMADAGPYDSLVGPAADIPKLFYMPSGDLLFVSDINFDAYTGTASEFLGAFFYATSSDMGVTWDTPQWIVPNILPTDYQIDGVNWCGWDGNITSAGEVIIAAIYHPNDTNYTSKFFAHNYDGTSWTTTRVGPDDATDRWVGIWSGYTTSQQGSAIIDGSGNAYIYWEDIYKIVADTNFWGIAGVKYDGTSWGTAQFIDTTTIGGFGNMCVGDKVDDNGNILFGYLGAGDSLFILAEPVLGLAEKKHTSVTKLDLTAPGLVRNSTTIRFSVANGGYGKLNVFDMSGKLVKTLVNGNVNAGNHSVVWNRTDNSNEKVSGGVYFYKLTVGNETVTRKIVAVK